MTDFSNRNMLETNFLTEDKFSNQLFW